MDLLRVLLKWVFSSYKLSILLKTAGAFLYPKQFFPATRPLVPKGQMATAMFVGDPLQSRSRYPTLQQSLAVYVLVDTNTKPIPSSKACAGSQALLVACPNKESGQYFPQFSGSWWLPPFTKILVIFLMQVAKLQS
jgi:hypothetical protein